jgi:hypothetical protein
MNDMPNSPDAPLPSSSAAPISDAAVAANPDFQKKNRSLKRPRPVAIASSSSFCLSRNGSF